MKEFNETASNNKNAISSLQATSNQLENIREQIHNRNMSAIFNSLK